MIKVLLIVLCCITPVLPQNCPIEEGWKRIRLFQTTRAEAEKILETASENVDNVDKGYQIKEGWLHIAFAHSPCSNKGPGRFTVAENTVLNYRVTLTGIELSKLNWKKDLYERFEDPHVMNLVHYYNKKDGIRLTADITSGKEVVVRIYFEGTQETETKFLCKEYK
ncbi:MAG: hypothetical protein H7070_14360 [Saprospiraceae bacterium]|nr:hypothetical protein [Pyrinomonadaceae bacterium]